MRAGGGDLRAAVSAVLVACSPSPRPRAHSRRRVWRSGTRVLFCCRCRVRLGSTAFCATRWGSGVGGGGRPRLLALCGIALADPAPAQAAPSPAGRDRDRSRRHVGLGHDRHGRRCDDARPRGKLSFVAPVGRALLQLMIEPFRNIGFGVAALGGVALASATVALSRNEFRGRRSMIRVRCGATSSALC